jgi:hypothetical protein
MVLQRVAGDDGLGGLGGAQPAHRSERVLELAVVGLDRLVRVRLDVMPGRRGEFVEHGWVDRGGVGDHLAGRHIQHRQRLPEEPAGGVGVPPSRHQRVDHLPVLVNGAIHVPPRAVDLDVGLVDGPAVTRCVPTEPGRVGQQRGAPLPHR